MARRRTRGRRRRSSPPFRAWGTLLSAALVLLLAQRSWAAAAGVAAALIFYLLQVRPAPCRVETLRHRPCRWTVRGLLACCDYHLGLKHWPPRWVSVPGQWLPSIMWPRYDLAWAVGAVSEPQPAPQARGAAAFGPGRHDSSKDAVMMWLAVASLVVAFLSLLRDLLAG